ncbi:hypothetical protein DINM_007255 [Dirofilaria immitis]|nr:hypothetical protein [Dirofilaria immitis]
MDLTFLTAKHLLVLCCNGGIPFIDLHTNSNLRKSTNQHMLLIQLIGLLLIQSDDLDVPLDQNTLNRCLELVQAHEARQDNLLKSSEHQRPLISTVYETCIPHRNTTVHQPPPPPPQPSYNKNYYLGTPPPSYRRPTYSIQPTSSTDILHNGLVI